MKQDQIYEHLSLIFMVWQSYDSYKKKKAAASSVKRSEGLVINMPPCQFVLAENHWIDIKVKCSWSLYSVPFSSCNLAQGIFDFGRNTGEFNTLRCD